MSDQKLIAAVNNLNEQIAALVVATQRVSELLERLSQIRVDDRGTVAVKIIQ